MSHKPADAEHAMRKAEHRFLIAAAAVLALALLAVGTAVVVLLWQVGNLEHSAAKDAHQHRQRNEDIHACIVAKEDAFRRDVFHLLQTKPGATPAFPEADGISCPAVNP